MFDTTDYNFIDETLELHEEEDKIQDEIQDDDSEYFLERDEILERVSVPRDLWDDLCQVNPDDLPFNDDFDVF